MNILVTGSDGFIGSNVIRLLSSDSNLKLFPGNRKSVNLYSQKSVESFIDKNEITDIVHCAIEGGHKNDKVEMFYNNLLMFENLKRQSHKIRTFINIASGAEYDRRHSLYDVSTYDLGNSIPEDYYGLSKYLISMRVREMIGGVNLRVFGCFGRGERPDRMISSSLKNYINGKPIVIHQDRFMDFFYIDDLVYVINKFLYRDDSEYSYSEKDLNMSYDIKFKLSEVARIINNLDDKKVPIVIQDATAGNDYCGMPPRWPFQHHFIGWGRGITEYYKSMKV